MESPLQERIESGDADPELDTHWSSIVTMELQLKEILLKEQLKDFRDYLKDLVKAEWLGQTLWVNKKCWTDKVCATGRGEHTPSLCYLLWSCDFSPGGASFLTFCMTNNFKPILLCVTF